MKFNNKYNIEPGFENLFDFKSKEEELEHEAKMIMFKFLSEFENLNTTNPVKKKDLANAIGTSASFITQLFQGDKLISLLTLAKLQDAYDFTFEIKAKANLKTDSTNKKKEKSPNGIPYRANDMKVSAKQISHVGMIKQTNTLEENSELENYIKKNK